MNKTMTRKTVASVAAGIMLAGGAITGAGVASADPMINPAPPVWQVNPNPPEPIKGQPKAPTADQEKEAWDWVKDMWAEYDTKGLPKQRGLDLNSLSDAVRAQDSAYDEAKEKFNATIPYGEDDMEVSQIQAASLATKMMSIDLTKDEKDASTFTLAVPNGLIDHLDATDGYRKLYERTKKEDDDLAPPPHAILVDNDKQSEIIGVGNRDGRTRSKEGGPDAYLLQALGVRAFINYGGFLPDLSQIEQGTGL